MSTYWYLECLDHTPALSSDDEVEQHTRGLHVIIDMVDLRADYIKASTVADLDLGSFERKAFNFIRQHPTCRMQLKSEYGDVQALPSTDRPAAEVPHMNFHQRVTHSEEQWRKWLALNSPASRKRLENITVETAFKAGIHMGVILTEKKAKEQS